MYTQTTTQHTAQSLLLAQLAQHGIAAEQWGTGDAKSPTDLEHELLAGESVLVGKPLRRQVRVAQLLILHDGRVLIEKEQRLHDGRIRRRRGLPSEKIRFGEASPAAALRCVQEELGLATDTVQLWPAPLSCRRSLTDSYSYPGLRAEYIRFTFLARAVGLPADEFVTELWNRNAGEPVVAHAWQWVPLEECEACSPSLRALLQREDGYTAFGGQLPTRAKIPLHDSADDSRWAGSAFGLQWPRSFESSNAWWAQG